MKKVRICRSVICFAVLCCFLLPIGCTSAGTNDKQDVSSNPGVTTVAFVNGMGCDDPTCTDPEHHHDCPEDCEDYSHHHHCDLDCTEESHHHEGEHHEEHHDEHHSADL